MRLLCSLSILSVLLLTGCLEDEVKAASTPPETLTQPSPLSLSSTADSVTNRICAQKQFPASAAVENEPLLAGYTDVCRLTQLRGIDIAGTDALYLCQSELFQPEMATAHNFKAETVKQKLGESAEQADILATGGFAGKSFGLLLLKSGDTLKVVSTIAQLTALPLTLRNAEAALAYAYLTGNLGRGMGNAFAPEALCNATMLETAEGWELKNALAFENCKPKEQRDLTLSRNGKIHITRRHTNEGEPALCID